MSSPKDIVLSPLILRTKLYPPRITADLIVRPRLLDRLNQGLKRTLTLICAPPGFGKTTLASQWLAGCDQPSAWLSLDERDNQLPKFLSYFCAAARLCFPETFGALQTLLNSANLPDPDYLVDLLIEELEALPTDFILVLDDYHHIHANDVHRIIRRLLRYRPSQLHLVILSRTDPPLSLGRLQVEDQVIEIRAADLRFALAETRLFLQRPAVPSLDDTLIQELHTRTEGWVTGLQVAGISLQHQPLARSMARFDGSNQILAVYLMEEVMADLPEAVSEFLTRTALVNRFCAHLADALLADTPWSASSQTTIAWLETQNLFIVPLDGERTWYRYHDLFRDFLVRRLKKEKSPVGLAGLHLRAGEWLAQAGLIEGALHHVLASGDEEAAADLLEANLQPLLNQQVPAPMLKRWLDLFPETVIQDHPGLLIAQAYLLAVGSATLTALATTVDRIGLLIGAQNAGSSKIQRLRLAILDILRGYVQVSLGEPGQAIPLLRRGLENLTNTTDPAACSFSYTQGLAALALAYASRGEQERAQILLRQALVEATARLSPAMMILLGTRARIHLCAGQLAEVAHAAEEMLSWADTPHAGPNWSDAGIVQVWRGWARYYLGAIRYEQNDLEAAAAHWRQVEAARHQIHSTAAHDGLACLASIAQIQGEVTQALAYVLAAREFAFEMSNPFLMEHSDVLEARLAVWNGDPAKALRRLKQIDVTVNQGGSFLLQSSHLTALHAYLAEAGPASLGTARQLAETCLCRAEAAHNTRQIIQLTALQALVWCAMRHTDRAFEALNRALTLAEPGGFVRTFLDLGTSMADLLQQFDHQNGPSPYVKRLLAAFAREQGPAGRRALTAQSTELYHITPLTPRELELLALIGRRFTVNEMAESLVISPNTAKKHVSNIYAKLDVNNRREAVAKAEEAGLLPPA